MVGRTGSIGAIWPLVCLPAVLRCYRIHVPVWMMDGIMMKLQLHDTAESISSLRMSTVQLHNE